MMSYLKFQSLFTGKENICANVCMGRLCPVVWTLWCVQLVLALISGGVSFGVICINKALISIKIWILNHSLECL